jgi:hypothetical protein
MRMNKQYYIFCFCHDVSLIGFNVKGFAGERVPLMITPPFTTVFDTTPPDYVDGGSAAGIMNLISHPEQLVRWTQQLDRHAEVVAAAFREATILPVEAGRLLFPSDEAMTAWVRQHHSQISQFLASAQGHDQYVIRIRGDTGVRDVEDIVEAMRNLLKKHAADVRPLKPEKDAWFREAIRLPRKQAPLLEAIFKKLGPEFEQYHQKLTVAGPTPLFDFAPELKSPGR